MRLGIHEIFSVAARSSRLSRVQVAEVLAELHAHCPTINFIPSWVETRGDRDLSTSLRLLDKTDFFTYEVDKLVLQRQCRIAIHSAKDLPEPLPNGLQIVAVTRGVDSSDALVYKNLPKNARVGVSSARREEAVKRLFPFARCCDIRGTIESRLAQLEEGLFDAVVIAEAALIRLGLTHLARLRLEGATAPLQGKLAALARADDSQMQELFRCIDDRAVSRI